MDICLGDEIRRQTHLSEDDLLWLEIHEKLEVDHAEDSSALAMLAPSSKAERRATWAGASDQWKALWGFLDDVDALSKSYAARRRTGENPGS